MFVFSVSREQGRLTISIKSPISIPGIPTAVKGHSRAAARETLLIFRSLIDETISAIERKEKG